MNLITIILVVSFIFAFTDFINFKGERIHEQFYKISLFIVVILSTIKYFYGPDVLTYYDLYNTIESPSKVLFDKNESGEYYEKGFLLFISVCKSCNIGFYFITVMISLFYFYAIDKLFKLLPSKRALALCLLLLLDNKLVMVQFRQCIAVSFFILLTLAYIDRKYIKCFLYAALMVSFHKSSLVVLMLLMLVMLIKDRVINKESILILLVLFIVMLALPLENILANIANVLNISDKETIKSIIHHLSLMSVGPLLFVLYFICYFVFLNFRISEKFNTREYKIILVMVFVSLLIIAVFFKYYYMLQRLRSFILPFLIIGTIYQITNIEKHNLYKSLISIYIISFITYSIFIFDISSKKLHGNIYKQCTIFSALKDGSEAVIEERRNINDKYWYVDRKDELNNMKGINPNND